MTPWTAKTLRIHANRGKKMNKRNAGSHEVDRPVLHFLDVSSYTTHAAHANTAVADGQWRAAQAGGG